MGGELRGLKIGIGLAIALTAGFAAGSAAARSAKTYSGTAAYYSEDYRGLTASGARYDPSKFTCAHRTLPFGTRLRVTDPHSRRSVTVVVNDRGPFNKGRMLDLSLAAAKALRMKGRGVIRITATVESGKQEAAAAR